MSLQMENRLPAAASADFTEVARSSLRTGPLTREFAVVLQLCRSDFHAYRDIVLNGREPIGIHQARVALRRLRAALWLFRGATAAEVPEDFGRVVRRLASICGPARDWDVFIGETLPSGVAALRASLEPARRAELNQRATALSRTARQIRRGHHDAARQGLQGPDFAAFEQQMEQILKGIELASPAGHGAEPSLQAFARDMLDRNHCKLRKTGASLDDLTPEALHRLRIRLKRQRYAASLLRHLFDASRANTYMAAAADAQDALGAVNDRAVALGLLDVAMSAARPAHAHDWLAGALAVWLTGETSRRHALGSKAWRKFREAERFWQASGDKSR